MVQEDGSRVFPRLEARENPDQRTGWGYLVFQYASRIYGTAVYFWGGYPLVSESAKAVLEQFDLGETVFHPLKLMDSDETRFSTPEPYYLLNVGNKRSMGNYEAIGPEGDSRAPLNCRGGGIRYLPRSDKESQLVVAPDALNGPDIWLDPKVPKLLFLSDQLVTGLKAAGVDKGWGLVRCAVGTL